MKTSIYCCRKCEDAALAHLSGLARAVARTFVTCESCGNKRCPKATNHELECTNSNASGQPGSDY
jgi:hypothetical protein